jgi:hypothetical protein
VVLTERLYERVRERERQEPDAVRPVLQLLASPDRPVDVTAPMRQLATDLTEQRDADARSRRGH